jgi:hypothetical protein
MEIIVLEVQKKCDVYKMYFVPVELDNPSIDDLCYCNTLKDFVAWDYNRRNIDVERFKNTFINDNPMTIGNNYSA